MPWSFNGLVTSSARDLTGDGSHEFEVRGAVEVKGELFARAAEEHWLVALSHEPITPVGRLTPDRDRYRFEPV